MKEHSIPQPRLRSRTAIAIAVVFGLIASSFSLIAAQSVSAAQEGDFGTAAVTPETALVYLRANLHTDSDQWALADELIARSGLSEAAGEDISLGQISEMEPSIDGEVGLVLTSLDPDQPVDLDTISNAASDPLALSSDIPGGFAVVIQPTDVDAVTAELETAVADTGVEIETSDYNGTSITYAPPVDEYSDGYAYAQINDETLAIATVPEDLEPIIDTASGEIAPISENDKFNDLLGKLNTDSLLFGYVDGAGLVEQALAMSPETEAMIPEELIAQASGTVGLTVYADAAGFRFDSLIVPAEGAELPELPVYSPTLADRVSADSLVFLSGSDIGPSGALDSLALILAESFVLAESEATPGALIPEATPTEIVDPEAYADEIFAQAEAELGFDIKADFVDQLVDEYALSVSVKDFFGDAPELNAIFVSGVADEATVTDTLTKFSDLAATEAPEEAVTTRELADGTILHQLNIGDEEFPMVLELGVIDGQLVIGLNNGIDEYVDGPAEALADDPNYQTVFASLPTEITGASFVNVPKILPIIDGFIASLTTSTPDNDPACAEYASQEEAQTAFDEEFNFDLDLDFDGEACEDYFNPATPDPDATPVSPTAALNILGIGTVTYDADGDVGQSTLIAIGE